MSRTSWGCWCGSQVNGRSERHWHQAGGCRKVSHQPGGTARGCHMQTPGSQPMLPDSSGEDMVNALVCCFWAVSVACRNLCCKAGVGAIPRAAPIHYQCPCLGAAFPAVAGHTTCLTPVSISASSVLTLTIILFPSFLFRLPDHLCAGSCLETDDVLGRNGKVY